MRTTPTAADRLLATVWVAIIVTGVMLACMLPAGSQEERPVTPNLVIIGDSIAGGQHLAEDFHWVNAVSAATGLEIRRYASPNSGIAKRSNACTGGTYLAKLNSIPVNHPSKIIVEDGIGDRLKCVNGEYASVKTLGEYEDIVEDFMHQLALKVVAEGLPRDQVFFLTPTSWKVREYDWTRKVISDAATLHGFTNVPTVYLTVNQTSDGFHPNEDGHDVLTSALLDTIGTT